MAGEWHDRDGDGSLRLRFTRPAIAQERPMKAVVHSSYGAPDALELNGIDRPVDRSSEASRSSSSGPRVGWAASRCSWAKAFGAQVTAVCSTRRADLVGSIGADQVIDSTQGTAPGRGGAMAWSWSWLGTVRWRRCGVRSPQRGRWCWWAGRVVGGCWDWLHPASGGGVAVCGQRLRSLLSKPRGADLVGAEAAHRSREGDAGHRPKLPTEPDAWGDQVCRRAVHPRQNRHPV
jgi:hypothetical protein